MQKDVFGTAGIGILDKGNARNRFNGRMERTQPLCHAMPPGPACTGENFFVKFA